MDMIELAEKQPGDAPIWLDAEEANAWADGYNAAAAEAATALTAAQARIRELEAQVTAYEAARSAEPVAWQCWDLIADQVTVIADKDHALARARSRAWRVFPLFASTTPEAPDV